MVGSAHLRTWPSSPYRQFAPSYHESGWLAMRRFRRATTTSYFSCASVFACGDVAERRALYADSYSFCASIAQFIWRFTSEMRTFAAALVTYVVPSLAVPEDEGVPEDTAAVVAARASMAGRIYSPWSRTPPSTENALLSVVPDL